MRTSHPLVQANLDSTIENADEDLSNTPMDGMDSDSGNSND